MIEEIMPELYKIQIPLPNNPLKNLNSYLVKGDGRNLLIDTGFNHEECRKAMTSALQELDVLMEETDIFITHLHADHSGLVASLMTENSTAYMSKIDANLVNRSLTKIEWAGKEKFFRSYGFPEEELVMAEKSNPAKIYLPSRHINYTFVEEGEIIQVGRYSFTCIATPGHSPGHMCLYEQDKKVLICGDHILDEITPNITIWVETTNPLALYLESLEKVRGLEIAIALPAHRKLIDDCYGRIEEIKKHHQERLMEILKIINSGEKMTAYEIAAKMSWSLSHKSWDDYPPAQKWFAMGEAMAHLEYLAENNSIEKIKRDGNIFFKLKSLDK
ncbi:MAG: MBL fold metallo-hydrolase [Clostridia bacterium]|nr:MBL fold metallo-hydrolase [Clostridia bacterium]